MNPPRFIIVPQVIICCDGDQLDLVIEAGFV
jgi:hypothetical protein